MTTNSWTTAQDLNLIGARFLVFVLLLCHVTLNFEGSLRLVRPEFFFPISMKFGIYTGWWLIHDGMPYDPIQRQGHEWLKATQEESTVSPMQDYFLYLNPHLILVLWAQPSHQSKWHLDRLIRFCRTLYTLPDRPTDRPRHSVCNSMSHLSI